MNAWLRMLWSGISNLLLTKLLPWLVSEAARFTADYLSRAVEVVKTVQASTDIPGPEKFRLAGDMLRVELRTQSIQFADHWVDTAIQAAVCVMKDESALALEKLKVGK